MKRLVTIFLLFLGWSKCYAQYVRQDTVPGQRHTAPAPYNFEDHISIGGNVGLQFGNVTIVGISPLINYHVSNSFIVGVGPIYQYYNFQESGYSPYSASIYGGRIVAVNYLPGKLSNIFLMGEYDVVNVPYYDYFTGYNSRTTIGIPLLGAGYRQPIGSKSYFTIAGLWDFSGSPLSPYSNPVIITGFDFGL